MNTEAVTAIKEELKKAIDICVLYEDLDDKSYLLNKIGEVHGMANCLDLLGEGVSTMDDYTFDQYLHFMDLQAELME